MKMIPAYVYRFPSRAERHVFDLLGYSTLDGYALHSLNIASHAWKPWTEIDFVCITSFGLLALEVKGGRISRHEGRWYTNEKPLKESPFDQVRTAIYELTNNIKTQGASFGWAVVMPNSTELPSTSEHPREMQAIYSDCPTPEAFAQWLGALEEYWINRLQRHRPIDSRARSKLIKRLRPNFDAAVPLGRQAELLDQQIMQFTEEQFACLDNIDENDQILCRGGAGTGKTFLAVEVAKRESAQRRSVLVVARSRPLVEWIAKRLDIPDVAVHSAEQLASSPVTTDEFDVLVVDEGQDLLSMQFIECFDALLKGGIANGRWRWFMDDQHQAGFHDDTDPAVVELLQERGVTLQRLRVNCRNTRQIVEFTQYTTGADIGEARLHGGGHVPEFEFVTPGDETARLKARLQSWHREQEVGFDRMAVLVCDPRALDRTRDAVDDRVRVESVRDFKGLEAEFVALVGIPAEVGVLDRMTSELYTGLTRARIELWVAVPASIEQEWKEARTENARRKIEIEFGGTR